jgi:hypothetical protein
VTANLLAASSQQLDLDLLSRSRPSSNLKLSYVLITVREQTVCNARPLVRSSTCMATRSSINMAPRRGMERRGRPRGKARARAKRLVLSEPGRMVLQAGRVGTTLYQFRDRRRALFASLSDLQELDISRRSAERRWLQTLFASGAISTVIFPHTARTCSTNARSAA